LPISLKGVRLCDFPSFVFATARRNQFKMWSVFALEYVLRLSDIAQPLLEPSLPWPVPILPWEPIAVIRAAVHFALKKNKLPANHKRFSFRDKEKAKIMPVKRKN
jgi:hypothetical protein